jgi:hypothetical protein
MQVKIYINDKLYKTVPVAENNYDPKNIWMQVQADKDSGLLSSFGVDKQFNIRIEKVS